MSLSLASSVIGPGSTSNKPEDPPLPSPPIRDPPPLASTPIPTPTHPRHLASITQRLHVREIQSPGWNTQRTVKPLEYSPLIPLLLTGLPATASNSQCRQLSISHCCWANCFSFCFSCPPPPPPPPHRPLPPARIYSAWPQYNGRITGIVADWNTINSFQSLCRAAAA